MKKASLLCLLFLLVACSQRQNTSLPDGPVVLKMDLSKESDPKRVAEFIQGMEIRLVPLETTDESIMNSTRPFVSADGIFTYDYDQSAIFHFGLDGEYINTIQRQGQGGEEYNGIRNWTVRDGYVYILDQICIQVYDLQGNHIKRIPVEIGAYDLLITPDGKYVTSSRINEPYILKIYDDAGKIAEYTPDTEKLKDIINFARPAYNTLGWHNGDIYFCQYYDHTIYHLKDGEVKPLYIVDLGPDRIPEEMFEGTPDQKANSLETNKYNMVVSLQELTITDEWIIFNPEKWAKTKIVYYNKNEDFYIINNSLPYPYSTIFGEYKPPAGCINGEYYFLIQATDMKELLEDLQAKGDMVKYDFLKDLDPGTIDEDDNAWAVFYKLP
ncbi:MAG: 6-bladed beta-propeller [Tannerellaceae bacterium]|nr:6-bladed beta-propeller [Tannerellaceae bacterium]